MHTTASVANCRDTERRCIPLHPLPTVVTSTSPVSKLRYPCDSMKAARFPHALSMGLHGGCQVSTRALPYQFSVPVLHTNVADKNRFYTSIHHVSEQTPNSAVLKRAENITRHFEMWSVVRQKKTVRASRKMCSGLKNSVTKIVQVHQWCKNTIKQRIMLASLLGCGTIRPKPIDILAVGIVTHHVCLQNLKAGAAHVIMNDGTRTGITELFLDLCDAHV